MPRLAGPLLDDGGQPVGSVVIIDAPDRAAAETLARADPYVAAECCNWYQSAPTVSPPRPPG
jgi:uncharacterized protein YciI